MIIFLHAGRLRFKLGTYLYTYANIYSSYTKLLLMNQNLVVTATGIFIICPR